MTFDDADRAVACASILGARTADERDGGFSDEDVAVWSETAVDPPTVGDSNTEADGQ
ncbi:hypothetical protein [Halosimplex halobium]|uniref:hypothetical protein n=1 Tax=Halosimplex halobium TaxID=3396618 RepID=UPI003F56C696